MKKRVFALIQVLILTFFTVGCSALSSVAPNFNKGYSFNAEIVYNKTSVKGSFTRISEGVWEGILTEPYALQGINMRYDRGKISFGLEDLSVSFENESLPIRYVLDAVENAFIGNYLSANEDKTSYTLGGENDEYSYELVISKAGNIPLSLNISKLDLNVNFNEAVLTELKPYDPAYFEDDTDGDVMY